MRFCQLNERKPSGAKIDSPTQIAEGHVRNAITKGNNATVKTGFIAQVAGADLRDAHEFTGIDADAPDGILKTREKGASLAR